MVQGRQLQKIGIMKMEEAGVWLSAGQYQAALSSYLTVAAGSSDARELVRGNMLHALTLTLDSLCSGEGEERGKGDTTHTLKWEGSLSEVAKRVYSLYKEDPVAMTMLGVKCLEGGLYEQAKFFLHTALQEDPEYLVAKEELCALSDCIVERWHFHMLNDVQRNSAYSRAIQLALEDTPHCTIVDIGSGTGILNMLAVRSGAEKVYAVEVNGGMVAMSRDILAANGMSEKVPLLHTLSTALSVPRDIPNRVNLVVTETVDAGLLGEHVIPTFRHAWKELLLPPPGLPTLQSEPGFGELEGRGGGHMIQAGGHMIQAGGHVIPAGATVYAVAIECEGVGRNSCLLRSTVAGVSLDSARLEGSCKGSCSRKGTFTGELEREVYSCERLSTIRGGYTSLTQPQAVLKFDFNQPEILLPSSHTSLLITRAGRLDAIAVWFDLHLYADISISTSPNSDPSWEQAVFPVPAGARTGGQRVEAGGVVGLRASCSDKSLFMEVEGVGTRGSNSLCRCSDERAVFYVERSDLSRLNDAHFTSSYHEAIGRALRAVREEGGEEKMEEETDEGVAECLLLDMCHGLSLFGLAAAKLGADFVQVASPSPAYQVLLETLAAANEVSDCVSVRELDMRQCHAHLEWDVVLCDVVSPQGNLRGGVFEKLAYLSSTQLCPTTSLVLPSCLTVHALLVSSPALRARSSVLGTVPMLGLEIAPFINQYRVRHFVDLDLSTCPLQQLSETLTLMRVQLGALGSGPLELSVEVPVKVTASGSVTGIAYWFTLQLFEDIVISTAPAAYPESHWHQCVFMLEDDIVVSKGDNVTIKGLLRDSCLDISLVRPPMAAS